MPLGHPVDQEFILYEDGTTCWANPNSWASVTQQGTPIITDLNQWGDNGYIATPGSTYQFIGFMFPQPHNITAFAIAWGADAGGDGIEYFQTSTDAQNFQSGTWTQRYDMAGLAYWQNADTQKMRQPWSVDWQNVKGIRLLLESGANGEAYLYEIRLWGNYTRPGLALWDATLDQIMSGSSLDFGDVSQGSNYTRQFRIKNNYSQTANNVVVTAPTGGIGDILNTLQFSDGGAYANNITITSIAPGTISPVITARRTVGVAAPLQIGCARVTATAGSWT